MNLIRALMLAVVVFTFEPVFGQQTAVFDPSNTVQHRLKSVGIDFRTVDKVDDLTAPIDGVKLVIVGANCLHDADATSSVWRKLLDRGVNLLVLEQLYPCRPLHGADAIPEHVWLWETDKPSIIEDAGTNSPVFAGIDPQAFTRWSKPTRFVPVYGGFRQKDVAHFDPNGVQEYKNRLIGDAVQLLGQSTETPICAPVLQFHQGKATAVLSQLPTGQTLDKDPLAQQLFDNLLKLLRACQK